MARIKKKGEVRPSVGLTSHTRGLEIEKSSLERDNAASCAPRSLGNMPPCRVWRHSPAVRGPSRGRAEQRHADPFSRIALGLCD